MQISNITTPSQSFGANLNSPKLKFKNKDFFVNIHGFGKNIVWAHYIKETADTSVNLIRKDTAFENVLRFITAGVTKANKYTLDMTKKNIQESYVHLEKIGAVAPSGTTLLQSMGINIPDIILTQSA